MKIYFEKWVKQYRGIFSDYFCIDVCDMFIFGNVEKKNSEMKQCYF